MPAMTPDEPKRLLLVPGLGTDARLFAHLRPPPGWTIVTLPFLLHRRGESLRGYARRMADLARRLRPDAIGGSSFGGMIAQEMAHALGMPEVIVIDSVRSGGEVPPARFRFFSVMTRSAPTWLLRRLGDLLFDGMMRGNRVDERLWPEAKAMLAEAPWDFTRWSVPAILSWPGLPPDSGVRIRDIHGEHDEMFPLKHRRTPPERVVRGAGHMLPYSAPEAVSEFLAEVLGEAVAPEAAVAGVGEAVGGGFEPPRG